jgi:hypothetical protein
VLLAQGVAIPIVSEADDVSTLNYLHVIQFARRSHIHDQIFYRGAISDPGQHLESAGAIEQKNCPVVLPALTRPANKKNSARHQSGPESRQYVDELQI